MRNLVPILDVPHAPLSVTPPKLSDPCLNAPFNLSHTHLNVHCLQRPLSETQKCEIIFEVSGAQVHVHVPQRKTCEGQKDCTCNTNGVVGFRGPRARRFHEILGLGNFRFSAEVFPDVSAAASFQASQSFVRPCFSSQQRDTYNCKDIRKTQSRQFNLVNVISMIS